MGHLLKPLQNFRILLVEGALHRVYKPAVHSQGTFTPVPENICRSDCDSSRAWDIRLALQIVCEHAQFVWKTIHLILSPEDCFRSPKFRRSIEPKIFSTTLPRRIFFSLHQHIQIVRYSSKTHHFRQILDLVDPECNELFEPLLIRATPATSTSSTAATTPRNCRRHLIPSRSSRSPQMLDGDFAIDTQLVTVLFDGRFSSYRYSINSSRCIIKNATDISVAGFTSPKLRRTPKRVGPNRELVDPKATTCITWILRSSSGSVRKTNYASACPFCEFAVPNFLKFLKIFSGNFGKHLVTPSPINPSASASISTELPAGICLNKCIVLFI